MSFAMRTTNTGWLQMASFWQSRIGLYTDTSISGAGIQDCRLGPCSRDHIPGEVTQAAVTVAPVHAAWRLPLPRRSSGAGSSWDEAGGDLNHMLPDLLCRKPPSMDTI